jgi:hypothetical protein
VVNEVGSYARNKSLETLVPSVFLPVQNPVSLNHPTHVHDAMPAQRVSPCVSRRRTEQSLDTVHRPHQICALLRGETIQDSANLRV